MSPQVWYYARPFRVFGSIVQTLGEVINDCIAVISLGLFAMVGYAVAFYVLFRHTAGGVKSPESRGNDVSPSAHSMINDSGVDLETAFGTIKGSILTLFCALLGEFDFEVKCHNSLGQTTYRLFSRFIVPAGQTCLG